MPDDTPILCCLCERPFRRAQLTKHHYLPREKGGDADDIGLLCPQCHGMVHATFTNATLAILYPTPPKRASARAGGLFEVGAQTATEPPEEEPPRRRRL
jgi:hypothetical protein